MEHDVVLADEMDQPRFGITPVIAPTFRLIELLRPLDRRGNVSNRRIKPDIEYLAGCSLQRNRDSPVDVPGDSAVGEPLAKPPGREFPDVAFPLGFGSLPLFEWFLKLREAKVPVCRCSLLRHRPADLATGFEELVRLQPAPAGLTLVAAGSLAMAVWALTFDVTVG